jgi:hypothetical protein
MISFLSKNRFINYALKNRLNIRIKKVHTTCRNIKALLRVIQLLYIYIYIYIYIYDLAMASLNEYVILTKFFDVSFEILQIFHTCFKFPMNSRVCLGNFLVNPKPMIDDEYCWWIGWLLFLVFACTTPQHGPTLNY